VPLGRTKAADMPSIFDFSAESAKIEDWIAEQDEFELSGDFEIGQ